MSWRSIVTRRGAATRVLELGAPDARAVLFLHGVARLLEDTAFLDALAQHYHVLAPELPGYGESTGEHLLDDMLDFTLHAWDIATSLELQRPVVIGHSLGGMIAAEMACLAPAALEKLVLIDPFGLWLDAAPIPDLYALTPLELMDLLGIERDLSDAENLRAFVLDNARRLGTASKLLFPIPNRRVSKRLYRATSETLVIWAEQDRLMPPIYAERWLALLPNAKLACIRDAGHMLPYEQPEALAQEIFRFVG